MGLILRIQPTKPFRLRNNANGQEAVFEIRRSVTRPDSWVLVLHDDAQLFGLGLEPRPLRSSLRRDAKRGAAR